MKEYLNCDLKLFRVKYEVNGNVVYTYYVVINGIPQKIKLDPNLFDFDKILKEGK